MIDASMGPFVNSQVSLWMSLEGFVAPCIPTKYFLLNFSSYGRFVHGEGN
jgi:hypothetical protein